MRAFVAPQDRVIVVGSCPPAPRGSRRPGPAPGERRVVLGAGLPAPRTIPTGRRRRTVVTSVAPTEWEFDRPAEESTEPADERPAAERDRDAEDRTLAGIAELLDA